MRGRGARDDRAHQCVAYGHELEHRWVHSGRAKTRLIKGYDLTVMGLNNPWSNVNLGYYECDKRCLERG